MSTTGDSHIANSPSGRTSVGGFFAALFLGVVVGVMLGLSAAPLVATIVGSLLAVATAFAGLDTGESHRRLSISSSRSTGLAVGLLASLPFALHARTHEVLGASPEWAVSRWKLAGYSDEEARALAVYELLPRAANGAWREPHPAQSFSRWASLGFTSDQARLLAVEEVLFSDTRNRTNDESTEPNAEEPPRQEERKASKEAEKPTAKPQPVAVPKSPDQLEQGVLFATPASVCRSTHGPFVTPAAAVAIWRSARPAWGALAEHVVEAFPADEALTRLDQLHALLCPPHGEGHDK